jgi:hypothetical protein
LMIRCWKPEERFRSTLETTHEVKVIYGVAS